MSSISIFDEKGISPLIAAVLLIAFTMSVAAILATWAQTFGEEKLRGAREEGERAIECSELSVRVESASYTDSEIRAVTWNMGNRNLTDFNFLVYNSTGQRKVQPENENVTVEPGDFVTLRATGITGAPTKISILSNEDRCPKAQPLYTCRYYEGSFTC